MTRLRSHERGREVQPGRGMVEPARLRYGWGRLATSAGRAVPVTLLDVIPGRANVVGAPGRGRPREESGPGLREAPAWRLLEAMVMPARRAKIALVGVAAGPCLRVVKVAVERRRAAAGRGAGVVTSAHEIL